MKIHSAILVTAMLASGVSLAAQTAAPKLPEPDRTLARSVLKELIEINSEDSDGSVTAAAVAMRNRLLAAGFPAADLVLAGPNDRKQNLVARYRGTPGSTLKPILFICHLDVVEARKADWTTDPFQLVEKDGYFYGRGTQDIKEEDAALVTNFIRLHREGWVPKRDIVIALTADEEGGQSNGVDWLLKNRPDLMQAAFVLNPDAGGVELRHGRATEVQVEATEKLYADFRITATNPGGHSSEPRPDNAIYELMHALTRLEASPFPTELNAVTRASLEASAKVSTPERAALIQGVLASPPDPAAVAAFSKDASDAKILHTTCVATMLKGGHAPNALPAMAEANVNCRILPGHSQEEVRQRLITIFADPALHVQYIADDGTAVERGSDRRSIDPPPALPAVFGPLQSAVGQVFPGTPIIQNMSAGASDSIYTMAAGIPSYGISGMAIDFDDNRAHGRDERIRVESFYTGVQFGYLFLRSLGK